MLEFITCIEWKCILLVVLLLMTSLVVLKLFEKKLNLNAEIKRKLFHMSMGVVMLLFPYIFNSIISVGTLGIIALVVLFCLKNTKLKNNLGTILYSVNRESLGEVFFVISVFTIFYLSKGDKILYSIPILVLTFADSIAALIGKNYAKKNLAEQTEDAKSLEGSFMFFMVAFMATLVPLLLFTTVGREETLIISTIIGFNVALIEMISHTGNDNLLIPLTTYAFLVTHINLDVEILRENLILLGAIFVIVTLINRVKTLSKLALVEVIVVGYLTISLYGIYAIVPPLMLFLTCMNIPRLKENEKNNIYDSRIIETNIVIGIAICGLVAITGYRAEFFMVYALAYAMHLTVNSFVRFKYFFNISEGANIFISFLKGLIFVFVPSLIVNKLIFGIIPSVYITIIMIFILFISAIIIKIQKRNVETEEITVKNGYMHTQIVLILSMIMYIIQTLEVLIG